METQRVTFFKLGQDSDTAPEFKSGFPFIYNCRILSTTDSNDGDLTTANGNTLVPFTLPSGNNTCIGYCEDKLTHKGYAFIYNSSANHSIIQYDEVTNTIAFVIQNKPTFDNTSIPLNFQLDFLITSCYVVARDANNHLLYWTDNYHDSTGTIYNEPKKINIEKGLLYMSSSGTNVLGYTIPFNPHFIDRIKEPPPAPSYVWSNNTAPIPQALPQVYNGGTNQAHITALTDVTFNPFTTVHPPPTYNVLGQWDASSKTFTVDATRTTGYYNLKSTLYIQGDTALNNVLAEFNLYHNGTIIATETTNVDGNIDVVSVSFSLTNYYMVAGDTLEIKCHVISTTISSKGFYVGMDLTNTILSFMQIDYVGASLIIPLNNNFKRLFNFQSQYGFDDKEKSVLSQFSGYVFPQTQLSPTNSTGEDFILQDNIITITVQTGSEIVTDIYIYAQVLNANGTDTITGTSLIVRLNKKDLGIVDNTTYDYTFLNDGNYTPLDLKTAISLFDNIFYWEQASEFFIDRIADANGADNCDAVSVDMRFPVTYDQTVDTNANPFFPKRSYYKSGAIYEEGLEYIYNGKRLSETNTATGKSDTLNHNGVFGTQLHIPFLTEGGYTAPTTGQPYNDQLMAFVPTVKGQIYNVPPSDAIGYSIVRSKMQNIESYLQFTSEGIGWQASDGTPLMSRANSYYLTITIANIIGRYKQENPNSNLVYDWSKGDRIRFIAPRDPAGGNHSSSQIQTRYEFNDNEIVSFNSGTQTLVVLSNPTIPSGVADNMLFEIYTPAKSITNDNEFCYEVGEGGTIGLDANGNLSHIPNNNWLSPLNQLSSIFSTIALSSGVIYNLTCPVGKEIPNGRNVKLTTPTWSFYGIITAQGSGTMSVTLEVGSLLGTITNVAGKIVACSEQTFTSGDCFRRYCDMPFTIPSVYRLYQYIETMWASNCWTSLASTEAWDYGRPNIINNNQKRLVRSADVSYSEQLIPNTNINGLSTVYDTSIQDYNQAFGGIQRMLFINDRLELYQSLKVFAGLVNQQIIESQSGQPIIAGTTIPLSPQGQYNTYYSANYGTTNPESLAIFDFRAYFLDLNNAAVVRRSNDGLINLPMESNMRIAFANLCTAILQYNGQVNCVGTYDIKYGTYILMISPFPAYPNGFTIEWNEKKNQFGSNWGYSGDYIGQNGNNIISFKNGGLWTHDTNTIQNNWYGVQDHSEIWVQCNQKPEQNKILLSIVEETTKEWVCTSLINKVGQETRMLYPSNWSKKEFNKIYSDVKFDINTPNVINGIVNGDPMRDTTFVAKFSYNYNDFNRLSAIVFNYENSYV